MSREKFSFGSIEEVQEHAKSWLFNAAAPLWSTAGVLEDGMFAERIGLDGLPETSMNRRMRVQARQIYSFCVLGQLGWSGPWHSITTRAVDILLGKGRREDGMFVHLFDSNGNAISRSLDLYDHAFGLFSLAYAARALNRPELSEVSSHILNTMMNSWWRGEGGFWEGELTPCPPFRQNPHMHMFEAATVQFQLTGNKTWGDLAAKLADLFVNKFQHRSSGAVTEYFDQEWNSIEDPGNEVVEPGHCLEWAWLFETGIGGQKGAHVSDRLTGFARQYGIRADLGVAINEVYVDGRLRDGNARLWPQTERLKAAVSRFERLRSDVEADEIVNAYAGLCRYLDMPVPGTWRDTLNADDTWVEESSPASSFYHIVCALNELIGLKV